MGLNFHSARVYGLYHRGPMFCQGAEPSPEGLLAGRAAAPCRHRARVANVLQGFTDKRLRVDPPMRLRMTQGHEMSMPKELSIYSRERLDAIADQINNRPGKGLGVRSPLAAYTELIRNSPLYSTLMHDTKSVALHLLEKSRNMVLLPLCPMILIINKHFV